MDKIYIAQSSIRPLGSYWQSIIQTPTYNLLKIICTCKEAWKCYAKSKPLTPNSKLSISDTDVLCPWLRSAIRVAISISSPTNVTFVYDKNFCGGENLTYSFKVGCDFAASTLLCLVELGHSWNLLFHHQVEVVFFPASCLRELYWALCRHGAARKGVPVQAGAAWYVDAGRETEDLQGGIVALSPSRRELPASFFWTFFRSYSTYKSSSDTH